jgi:hypothetical protein
MEIQIYKNLDWCSNTQQTYTNNQHLKITSDNDIPKPLNKNMYSPNNNNFITIVNKNSKNSIQISKNQLLSSLNSSNINLNVNPKTLETPIIVPHAYDFDSWKFDNSYNRSDINDENFNDYFNYSGFIPSTYCSENFNNNKYGDKIYNERNKVKNSSLTSITSSVKPINDNSLLFSENKNLNINSNTNITNILPSTLPQSQTNLSVKNAQQLQTLDEISDCSQNENLQKYFKEIETSIIEPNIFQNDSKVWSNIDEKNILEPFNNIDDSVSNSDVYDPRYNGYGTNYRSYNDEVTGQPRFYYDDIDVIRKPNYITRNEIDTTSFGDKYGPLSKLAEFGNPFNNNIQTFAHEHWTDSSLLFRTEMKERLMRKRNNELKQLKTHPKSGKHFTQGSKKIF